MFRSLFKGCLPWVIPRNPQELEKWRQNPTGRNITFASYGEVKKLGFHPTLGILTKASEEWYVEQCAAGLSQAGSLRIW